MCARVIRQFRRFFFVEVFSPKPFVLRQLRLFKAYNGFRQPYDVYRHITDRCHSILKEGQICDIK